MSSSTPSAAALEHAKQRIVEINQEVAARCNAATAHGTATKPLPRLYRTLTDLHTQALIYECENDPLRAYAMYKTLCRFFLEIITSHASFTQKILSKERVQYTQLCNECLKKIESMHKVVTDYYVKEYEDMQADTMQEQQQDAKEQERRRKEAQDREDYEAAAALAERLKNLSPSPTPEAPNVASPTAAAAEQKTNNASAAKAAPTSTSASSSVSSKSAPPPSAAAQSSMPPPAALPPTWQVKSSVQQASSQQQPQQSSASSFASTAATQPMSNNVLPMQSNQSSYQPVQQPYAQPYQQQPQPSLQPQQMHRFVSAPAPVNSQGFALPMPSAPDFPSSPPVGMVPHTVAGERNVSAPPRITPNGPNGIPSLPSASSSSSSAAAAPAPTKFKNKPVFSEVLRPIHVPTNILADFYAFAQNNTDANIETCGILCGKFDEQTRELWITHCLIPNQNATSDTCVTTDEEQLIDLQIKYDLLTLGWIHTHPSQTCFLSSIDMHTHYTYQLMMSESIAIVLAPKHSPNSGIFHCTLAGMKVLTNCPRTGFHKHEEQFPLYTLAPHVKYERDEKYKAKFMDLRPRNAPQPKPQQPHSHSHAHSHTHTQNVHQYHQPHPASTASYASQSQGYPAQQQMQGYSTQMMMQPQQQHQMQQPQWQPPMQQQMQQRR